LDSQKILHGLKFLIAGFRQPGQFAEKFLVDGREVEAGFALPASLPTSKFRGESS
jgi:hypothetical protein